MYEEYLITTKMTGPAKAVQSTNFHNFVQRITLAKTQIEGPHHKKRIIDMLAQVLGLFSRIDYTTITNKTTSYERRFYDVSELISWAKKQSLEKLCEIEFNFGRIKIKKEEDSRDIVFSVEESSYSSKAAKSKRLKLEIKDFFTDELIFQKNFSDFKKLCDEVHSFIDPSHKKFSPSNPCINVDCRFIVNDCDISDYFLGTENLNIECYNTECTQFIEYTKHIRQGRVTIHHVLAIEKDNCTPRHIYSSVLDEMNGKIREKGISEGHTWEREITTPRPADDLYYQIWDCCTQYGEKVSDFKALLNQYSKELPIISFVCIEMSYSLSEYRTRVNECFLDFSPNAVGYQTVSRSGTDEYDYLIPPHEKWNYEDFDVIL